MPAKLTKPKPTTTNEPIPKASDEVTKGLYDPPEVQEARKHVLERAKRVNRKNVLIFCDGTGKNALDESKTKTNVHRLFKCVANKDAEGRPQVAFYQQGIGTTPKIIGGFKIPGYDAAVGGLSGKGIHENIAILYWVICTNYTPGDDLFLFGFSRGAYTTRLLASLVADLGVIDPTRFGDAIDKQMSGCLKIVEKWKKHEGKLKESPKNLDRMRPFFKLVSIKVVGVWDTVASLGINGASTGFKFAEELPRTVENAFQALALTERRGRFKPVVWKKIPQEGKQVWFLGSHSAVGGGTKQEGIAIPDLSLLWMLSQLEGLMGIDEQAVENLPLSAFNIKTGKSVKTIDDSKKGLTGISKEHIRAINVGSGDKEFIHISVRKFEELTEIESRGPIFPRVLEEPPKEFRGAWTWQPKGGKIDVPEDEPNSYESKNLRALEEMEFADPDEIEDEDEEAETEETESADPDEIEDEEDDNDTNALAREDDLIPPGRFQGPNPTAFYAAGSRDIKQQTVKKSSKAI